MGVVQIARTWIGTPYVHQASVKGAGCDCLGLLRGVVRELRGEEPETPPPYSPDWAEATGAETLYSAMLRHLTEIDPAATRARRHRAVPHAAARPAKHCGIIGCATASLLERGRPSKDCPPLTLIHARQNKRVSEEVFTPFWRRKLAFVFASPLFLNSHGISRSRHRRLGDRPVAVRRGLFAFSAPPSRAPRSAARSAASSAPRSMPSLRRHAMSRRKGPRLTDINIQASSEGAPIPRLYGRMRVAGQLLWATRFKETATHHHDRRRQGRRRATVTQTDYTYSISFAVGLCEGVITRLGRVWADGNLHRSRPVHHAALCRRRGPSRPIR